MTLMTLSAQRPCCQDGDCHWPRISLQSGVFRQWWQSNFLWCFIFYQILISRERGPSPSPLFLFPALRDLASSWSDRDTAEEIAGPVRQKTHNQYVWVWSPQIWFLPISLSVSPPARSFPYFWFKIIKKQLMFVINIMQMDWGMRGRGIMMMDDWCWQLQLKTGIFITFNNGQCFVLAPQPYHPHIAGVGARR